MAHSTLEVEIDGQWLCTEMSAELRAIAFAYDYYRVIEECKQQSRPDRRALYHYLLHGDIWPHESSYDDLTITSISHSSPGWQRFYGLAKILDKVCIFLECLIDPKHIKKKNKAALAKQAAEINALNWKTHRDAMKLFKKLGFSNAQCQQIAAELLKNQIDLQKVIDQKKIKSVKQT